MTTAPRIGFIGIGMMGHGMAKNLLAKGYPLTLKVNRDRSRVDDLLSAGAKEATTNAGVARTSSSSASRARRRSKPSCMARRACSARRAKA